MKRNFFGEPILEPADNPLDIFDHVDSPWFASVSHDENFGWCATVQGEEEGVEIHGFESAEAVRAWLMRASTDIACEVFL